MKTIKFGLFLLLAITLLFGCTSESEDGYTSENNIEVGVNSDDGNRKEDRETSSNQEYIKTFDAKVESVVDGDTIKVYINGKVESVRFLLVDTPETNHPRLGKQPFGEEAKEFTRQMLEGKTVQLEKDVSDRDKYGRLLYYVYIDGKSVQEELLKNGLARVAYVYAPNTKYVDRYYEIQKEAQQKGIGIWSIENYAQEDGFHKEVVEEEVVENHPNDDQHQNPQTSETSTRDCNIKGNISSRGDKIYHMPGQQFYESTIIDPSKGERYFCSREEAEQAGFRPSKR